MPIQEAQRSNLISLSSALDERVYRFPQAQARFYPAAGSAKTAALISESESHGSIFRGLAWALALEAAGAVLIAACWSLIHLLN